MDTPSITRRDALRAVGGLGTAALAGCTGLFERRSSREPPLVENRPDAVYVPSHVEGMNMVGTTDAGGRKVALSYSFAHRFWTVTGTETNRASVENEDVHLMVSVWDPETGTVLPVDSGVGIDIDRDGAAVDSRRPWPMLSQNMGFHFGGNYTLAGDGTYAVTVEIGGLSANRVGDFADRFGDSVTAEFEWNYSTIARNEIQTQNLDKAGDRGAVDPMDMMTPLSFAPKPDALPGRLVGTGTSGDAEFVVTTTAGEEGDVLVVSPRTPHNRYVLPMMSLSATVTRDGSPVFDDVLQAAVSPDLGYHYRAPVDAVETGDEVTVTVDAPPQVSRHEGYETAFLQMPSVSLTAA